MALNQAQALALLNQVTQLQNQLKMGAMPQAQSGMDASNRLKRAVPQLRRRGNPTPRKKSSGSNNQAQMHMNQISQTNVLQQPQIAENYGQGPTGQGDFKIHLDVTKEDSSKKTFDLNFRPTCSVLNVKLDVSTFTNIPVSRQKWSGWPVGIRDDFTLAQIWIKREHHMSLSIAPRHTGRDIPNIDIDMEASTFGSSSRGPTSVASASSKKLENMELNLLPRRNSKGTSQQIAYTEIVSKFKNPNRHQPVNVNAVIPRLADELANQFSNANINPTVSPSSLCDVTLLVGKNKIYVHRLVLSMASKFFQKMFETDMKEANCKEVELKDIKLGTLKTLLKYIYTDEIDDKDVTVAVLAASDMYEVLGLMKICTEKLSQKLNDDNVAGVWVVAYQHSIKSLTHDAVVYMARRWNVLATNKDIVELIEKFPNLLITISDLLSTLLNTNEYPYNQYRY